MVYQSFKSNIYMNIFSRTFARTACLWLRLNERDAQIHVKATHEITVTRYRIILNSLGEKSLNLVAQSWNIIYVSATLETDLTLIFILLSLTFTVKSLVDKVIKGFPITASFRVFFGFSPCPEPEIC